MSDLSIPGQHNDAAWIFTDLQGQYLAFIHAYIKLHRVAPAEQDMERYFCVTPPTVHRMVMELEKRGLIRRTPRKARSIELRARRPAPRLRSSGSSRFERQRAHRLLIQKRALLQQTLQGSGTEVNLERGACGLCLHRCHFDVDARAGPLVDVA